MKGTLLCFAAAILSSGFIQTRGGTIVDRRWIDPAPPAQPAPADPIAAIIKRTPYLYDYLQCGASVPNPAMNGMLSLICAQMRP